MIGQDADPTCPRGGVEYEGADPAQRWFGTMRLQLGNQNSIGQFWSHSISGLVVKVMVFGSGRPGSIRS